VKTVIVFGIAVCQNVQPAISKNAIVFDVT
jgi:hypothetical protein